MIAFLLRRQASGCNRREIGLVLVQNHRQHFFVVQLHLQHGFVAYRVLTFVTGCKRRECFGKRRDSFLVIAANLQDGIVVVRVNCKRHKGVLVAGIAFAPLFA